ncbi:serine protease [Streptomyces indiaensis]|uniref:HEAT repeat domain-containing protein n=1 Tax=Streptomyces indiaensis TaxID=284033 RepID=A0ABN3DYA3_9ACTN|nr:serine protease [Streptomyces indiaensis]MCF1646503.1 trypsin-like peptidase domain-containing protein [Streptomyces indiaensis]
MTRLEDLLREATLGLKSRVPGGGGVIEGTGFLVAPGIVVTCAHVLADCRQELPGTVKAWTATGRDLVLETAPEWYLREQSGGLDLAFLRAPSDTGPHVLLSGVVETGESVWTWGHPAGRFRAGQSALFTAQGASRLRAVDADGRLLGDEWQPERVFGTPVGGGYSGSAVFSRRSGAVCGMLFSAGKEGSAHMVSAADILAALPQLAQVQSDPARNTRWLGHLDDDQIHIGGWPYPGPRLRAYLDAAILVAREHPYPGVVPGTRPPPLTAVHLRQRARPAQACSEDDTSAVPAADAFDAATVPAEEILDREGDALVIAGPGGGKSTLLRTGLITLAERWRTSHTGRWVPVLVSATALVPPRPLHEAIADRVKKDLSTAAPAQDWPPQFFNTEPLRGVRWLVMVDGLDEIADPEARRNLVAKLKNASARHGSPYRFIATTRPLSLAELTEQASAKLTGQEAEGWPARRYELLPFTAEDLNRFAQQWFTALDLPDPERTASDFISELQRRHLEGPARTPLMATMLCQLYSTNPKRILPDNRGQIYKDFINLLYKRQRTAGLRAQTQATLQECGQEALDAAEKTLKELQNLIASLAAERRFGNTTSALDLMASQRDAKRPERVPEAEWTQFLEESLRSSGLLTIREGEVDFLHPTLEEYLAAYHITRNGPAPAQANEVLNRLAEYSAYSSGERILRPFVPEGWWAHRRWQQMPEDSDSFVGFLLDLSYSQTVNSPRVEEGLLTLATQGLEGATFIVRQARLGTRIPDHVAHAATDTLAKQVRNRRRVRFQRLDAARELAWFDHQRATDLLTRLAWEYDLNFPDRIEVAKRLFELDQERGTDLLARLARRRGLARERGYGAPGFATRGLRRKLGNPHDLDCIIAALSVAKLDQERGADLLAYLARERTLGRLHRTVAAMQLTELDQQRGADLARDDGYGRQERRHAAETLVNLDQERGAELLAHLAGDDSFGHRNRIWAAKTVAGIDHQRGADLLDLLARDVGLDGLRIWAALALFELDHQRGADILALLTRDRSQPWLGRRKAAAALRASKHRCSHK